MSTSNIMNLIILLVVSILPQRGLSAHIPYHSRSSVPAADTGFCAKNSTAIINSTESSSIIPAISQTHQSHASKRSCPTSFNKREPKHIFFHMGRFKSYYELHPEKATDIELSKFWWTTIMTPLQSQYNIIFITQLILRFIKT